MGQKKFKAYRKAGAESAKKIIDENVLQIRNELLKGMVNESLWKRMKIAWLIIISRVEKKQEGKK